MQVDVRAVGLNFADIFAMQVGHLIDLLEREYLD